MSAWELEAGVVQLPSGRRIRGRSWHESVSEYADVTAILTTATPEEFAQRQAVGLGRELIYISWPDYRLPRRPLQARQQLMQLLERAREERVEITCGGGVGRTGTALAMMAIMDGMEPQAAIDFVQREYSPEAVKSHAQRGFLMAMPDEMN